LKAFNFKFHVFFAFILMNDVSLKPSYWNGSSSMKIYEILGWNKVHRKIIFIILFHSWSVGSSFTIIHFASKVIQISWMNIHKISFQVNFQWRNGRSFIDEISWTKFHVWKAELSWNKVHWWNQSC
jgi:hypothetical protein